MNQRERLLRAALRRSMVIIDDFLNMYAREQCDPVRVKQADARFREHGTLAYIASVQEQNRKALKAK